MNHPTFSQNTLRYSFTDILKTLPFLGYNPTCFSKPTDVNTLSHTSHSCNCILYYYIVMFLYIVQINFVSSASNGIDPSFIILSKSRVSTISETLSPSWYVIILFSTFSFQSSLTTSIPLYYAKLYCKLICFFSKSHLKSIIPSHIS